MTFGLMRHVLSALRRALARMLMWFLIIGAIAAVVVELVSIFATGGQLPTLLTHLAALAFGLAVGYAAAMTVLVAEMFRDLTTAVSDLEHDIEHGLEHGMHSMEAGGAGLLRTGLAGASHLRNAASDLEQRKSAQ